ncbi:endonuclease domain-containing protein [Demequina soli]|uniref:endonuclease domain-containing protein n=1 Tax=Demequina soli TaxID=1638987 RepID=UPI00078335CD|nr:hypothetical protein [Demequina soli]
MRVLPGIYAPAATATLHEVRCHAVDTATAGRAVIAGRSALHLYEPRLPEPAQVEAAVAPGRHRPSAPWLRMRFRERPPLTSRREDCDLLTREDALIDAWIRAETDKRKGLLYEALWLKVVTPKQAIAAAAKVRRVPDRGELDGILGEFLDGATSPGEVMARREVFTRPCDQVLERQVEIRTPRGVRRADLLHREGRVVVECDSEAAHGGREARLRDNERDAELAVLGLVTLHFDYTVLRDRPDWCRTMLDAAVATRLAQQSPGLASPQL